MMIGEITVVLLIGLLFMYYSYHQNVTDRTRDIAGCQRGTADRATNALAWRTAQRRALSQGQPGFAIRYDEYARSLELRAGLQHPVVTATAPLPDIGDVLASTRPVRDAFCEQQRPPVHFP